LLLEFVGGAHGVVEAFFNIPDPAAVNALEIYGTRGAVLARGTIGQTDGGSLSAYLAGDVAAAYDPLQAREPGEIRPARFEHVNTYRAEIEQFARHLISGDGVVISGEEAVRGLEVIEAGYRAARERAAVTLS
jgi:predicted dehydrogenase